MQPTARENGIGSLYHYQKFDPSDKRDQKRLADILINQRVHCSDPANLNDPWDCRPCFHELSVSDPTTRRELVAFLQPMVPDDPAGKALSSLLENDPAVLLNFLKGFGPNLIKAIPEYWGIYCLTPHPDSTLMWSHYAGNHRGICLEFGTESSLFGASWAVGYHSSYPIWHPHQLIKKEGVNILLSKSDAWKEEGEYRIIGVKPPHLPPESGVLIEIKDGKLDLPPDALKSVIVGCEADHDAVETVVRTHAPNLAIKRAERIPNQYRLQIK